MTQSLSFLHVADVHLDSPLAHLRRLNPAHAERLQRACRRSLENVVAAALEHQVAAVVLAGDLFDGPVKDAGAGLWVESQFKRLTREGITVVLIRGNHDARSNARRVIRWPERIFELGDVQPETLRLDDVGLAIHGQSFGSKVESGDLAASYPNALSGYFNIGVLHTSLSGNAQHDTYAPTSVGVLESKGYDYWALGHIHARSEVSLSSRCYVGYSGNTQGRHVREPGAKGCQLVNICDGHLKSIRFLPTDSLRWHELPLDIGPLELLSDIEDLLPPHSQALVEAADGRPLALRLRLEGATSLHAELSRTGSLDRLADTLSDQLSDQADIWLESLKIATRPPHLTSNEDLLQPLKYLRQVASEIREDEMARNDILGVLNEMLRKARPELCEVGWPLAQPHLQNQELESFIRRAEDLIISRLGSEP